MDLTRVCSPSTPSHEITDSINFTFYRGITFRLVLRFKDRYREPISIIDDIITFYIADEDNNILFTISSDVVTVNGSTIIMTDALNGIADLLITDEETALMEFDTAKWWMTLELNNGDVYLRGRGNITLEEMWNIN